MLTIQPFINYGIATGTPTKVPAKIEGDIATQNAAYESWSKAVGVGGPAANEDADSQPNLIEAAFGYDPNSQWDWGYPYLGVKWHADGTKSQMINFEHVKLPGTEVIPMVGDTVGGTMRPAKHTEVSVLMPRWGNLVDFASEQELKDYANGKAAAKFIDSGLGRQTFQVVAKAKIGQPASVLGVAVKLP